MNDKATDPPASPVSTIELSTIDVHGSLLEFWVIQQVARNADRVGIATTPLMTGSSCAAAITGIKKNAFRITSDVQASGAVRPVTTETTETTATSAASTVRVTTVRANSTVRTAVRSAHTLQHA